MCHQGMISHIFKNTILWGLFSILILSGCASPFATFKDPDSNAGITRMTGNKMSGGINSLELNAQRFEKQGLISYSLFVRYSGLAFLEIPPGETLAIIINGQRFGINGSGSEGHRNNVFLGLVEEISYYHNVDPGLILMIAGADEVQVEIKGSTGIEKRYFNKKNFLRFQEFCNLYMGKAADKP